LIFTWRGEFVDEVVSRNLADQPRLQGQRKRPPPVFDAQAALTLVSTWIKPRAARARCQSPPPIMDKKTWKGPRKKRFCGRG